MKHLLYLLLAVSIVACKEEIEPYYPEYYFYNESGVDIDFIPFESGRFGRSFSISGKRTENTLILGFDESVPEHMVPKSYFPFDEEVDNVLVIYDKTDSVYHSENDINDNSIYSAESYEYELYRNVPTYYFTFTSGDYQAAKSLNQ